MRSDEDLAYAKLANIPIFCVGRNYKRYETLVSYRYIVTISGSDEEIEIKKFKKDCNTILQLAGIREYSSTMEKYKEYIITRVILNGIYSNNGQNINFGSGNEYYIDRTISELENIVGKHGYE